MASNYTEWQLQCMNTRTAMPIDDDSGVCNVLTDGSPAEITIYSNDQGTSLSNPLTMTNGVIRFYTTNSVTSVDLSIAMSGGQSLFVNGVTPSQHRIDVNPELYSEQTMVVPFSYSGASETQVDSGFDLPGNAMVKDAYIYVTTVGTGMIMDIGNSGDTDGYLDAVPATTTGYIFGYPTFTNATGNQAYVATDTNLKGDLISYEGAGLVTATAVGNKGLFGLKKFLVSASASDESIVYTNITSSSTAGAGYIFIVYDMAIVPKALA